MFTVIIPVYNKAETLPVAIKSVLAQSFEQWELIIVDDGSTDDLEGALAPFMAEPRIRVVHEPNGGVSVARNHGLELAREPYIAFLDADDEWLPEHLSSLAEMIAREPGAGMYCNPFAVMLPGGMVRDDQDSFTKPGIWRETDLFRYIYSIGGAHIMHIISSCVSAEAVARCGGFDPEARIGEDTDFMLRIAAHYDAVLGYKITAIYHRELSTAIATHGALDMNWCFMKHERELLSDTTIPASKRMYIRRAFDHFRVHKARHLLMEGRRREALATLREVKLEAATIKRIGVTLGLACLPGGALRALYQIKRKRDPE